MNVAAFLLSSVAAATLMVSTADPGGGGPGGESSYALVYSAATQAIGTTDQALTFDSVVEDGVGAYSGAFPSRLTVPSAFDGRKVRIMAGARVTRGTTLTLRKNGSNFTGSGGSYTTDSSAQPISGCVVSATVTVNTGDYFEVFGLGVHSSTSTVGTETWLSMEVIGEQRAARVRSSVTQSLTSNVLVAASYDTEDLDDGGWWDAGQPTRFTAPADVSGLIQLFSGVEVASGSSETTTVFYKNGAEIKGGGYYETSNSGAECLVSGPLTAASGDYFEFWHRTSNTQTRPISDRTWFEIEELPATIQRAMVSRSSTLTHGTADAAIVWNQEDVDDGGWWSAGQPTRFTIPAGVTRVRLAGSVERSSEGNQLRIHIFKNGAVCPGTGSGVSATVGSDASRLWTAALPVAEGDYFEMYAYGSQGCNVQANARTWFAIWDMTDL